MEGEVDPRVGLPVEAEGTSAGSPRSLLGVSLAGIRLICACSMMCTSWKESGV